MLFDGFELFRGYRFYKIIKYRRIKNMKNNEIIDRTGNDKLMTWFGLSYASFLTMPRVLMQEMPDEWQSKMADLLDEYDHTFDTSKVVDGTKVLAVDDRNKFIKWPYDMLNYRHPRKEFIESLRIND